MSIQFQIPKQTDREIYDALTRVQKALAGKLDLYIQIHIPHVGGIDTRSANAGQKSIIDTYLAANSQVVSTLQLHTVQGHHAVNVQRTPEKPTDVVTLTDEWPHSIPDGIGKAVAHAALLSAARAELKAPDIEAAFRDSKDDSWSRYRDAQASVVNSLQQATETLIIKAAEKNAELDKARAERFEKLEVTLREQLEHERKTLQSEFEKKQEQVEARQKAIADREASFNTKEARYVARKKQEEQIDQVKNWLSDWRLTSGTTAKRRPIFWGYISALIITGSFSAYATYHNFELLKSADDIAKLAWWQWGAIMSKSLFPLAAFTTFMIYFIRWSGSWARQHADEEFRNRTRLIDIGRSGWLLEAVRDAQENKNEIPVDLLKELSRNLFSNAGSNEGDIHPQAVSDVLLQGLSSVRVKSADGSEVEATRNGKKK
jgi:hypothetical protein